MRDRRLSERASRACRTVIVVAAITAFSGCVTTAPIATEPGETFAFPSLSTVTSRPVGPDDELRIIGGYVTDTDGNRIPSAHISVSADGTRLDELDSANDGSFQVVGLYPPNLTLRVEADGYSTVNRTAVVDESQTQTFIQDIALTRLPAPQPVGSGGAVVRTPSGAAVAFQKGALADGSSVVVYDAIGAPPTDQLPDWDDGLIRTPLGWVETSISGSQPSKPAVLSIPLSESYDPGSVLEVRSVDAQGRWADAIQYGVVGKSGRSAITLVDHFTGWVVFTKRSQKVGAPQKLDPQELSDAITIGEGTENCAVTEPISIDLRTPPQTFNLPLGIVYYALFEPVGFSDTREQTVPSHTLGARVQGVRSWRAHGRLVMDAFSQGFRTEVTATWKDSVEQTRHEPIDWPDDDNGFVQDALSEYGPAVLPAGIDLPVSAERRTWNSETRVLEYNVVYPSGTPHWDVEIDTVACPSQLPVSTVFTTPTPGPPTAPPPATPEPVSFEITASSPAFSVGVASDGQSECHLSVFRSRAEISVNGAGLGSDGKSYSWSVLLEGYTGPGSFAPSSDTRDLTAYFDQSLPSGQSGAYSWAGVQPGSTNNLTINADERSGSFDVTIREVANSATPPGELRLTGSFAGCELRE
jgi:hypothetical protein